MKTTGLTQAVMAQIKATPRKQEDIIGALPKAFKKLAGQILYQKAKAGVIVRSGMPRNFYYSLKAPANGQSVNVRCADALRCVLEINGPLTRTGVIGEMPPGFGPAQIVAAMSDAIAEGWLRSTKINEEVCFELRGDAPEVTADPLAAAFVPFTPQQRVDQIHADLGALLEQMLGDKASPTVIHHIAAANHHLHQLHAYL